MVLHQILGEKKNIKKFQNDFLTFSSVLGFHRAGFSTIELSVLDRSIGGGGTRPSAIISSDIPVFSK